MVESKTKGQATLNEHGIECRVQRSLTEKEIGKNRLQIIKSIWQCEVEKDECQLRLNARVGTGAA